MSVNSDYAPPHSIVLPRRLARAFLLTFFRHPTPICIVANQLDGPMLTRSLALGLRIMPDLQSARFGVINLSFLARLAKAEGKMKYVIIEKYTSKAKMVQRDGEQSRDRWWRRWKLRRSSSTGIGQYGRRGS
jgi:hypothetical protein